MDTTFGTDQTKRVTLDVNQVISPTLAVRAGGLFQDADVAGRNYVTDDRNGGFVATTWTPIDAVKITANYIHTDLHGLPDFGVPYYRPSTVPTHRRRPVPGFRRQPQQLLRLRQSRLLQDQAGHRHHQRRGPDHARPDARATRSGSSARSLNYIGTLPESPRSPPNPLLPGRSRANPQSRYPGHRRPRQPDRGDLQVRRPAAGKHTALAGVEVSREHRQHRQLYRPELGDAGPARSPAPARSPDVSVFNPQYTYLPFGSAGADGHADQDRDRHQERLPASTPPTTTISSSSTAASATTTTASTRQRLRHRQRRRQRFGQQAQNSDCRTSTSASTLKPLPIGSVYAAYATSSNPVGAEFDGTSAHYGGLAPVAQRQRQPDLRAGKEQGDRSRHQVGAVRPAPAGDGRAVPDREGQCARVAERHSATRRHCPYPPVRRHVSCITAGAAYRIRGIDLGVGGKITDKWSVFGGLVLMQSEVTKSLVPPANPSLYPTNVGLPLANIAHQSFSLLTKYQLTDVWELGGQAVYRSKIYGGTLLAANQGTSTPELLALRRLRGSQDRQELDGRSCSSTTSSTSSTTTRCIRARRRSCSTRRAAPPIWCSRRGSDASIGMR